MKSFFSFAIVCLCVVLVASIALTLDFFKKNDLVLPRTTIGSIDLGGMTRTEAREAIRELLKNFNAETFQIAARGEAKTAVISDFGVWVNETEIINDIPFAGQMDNAGILFRSFVGRRVMPHAAIERPELLRAIGEKFSDIPKAKNAKVIKMGKNWKIQDAIFGVVPNIDMVVEQLRRQISFLEHSPMFVDFTEIAPTVRTPDIEANKDILQKKFPQKLNLVYEKKKWEADFQKRPDWIAFEKKPIAVSGEIELSMQWDPVEFTQFIKKSGIAEALEQKPEDVRIWREPDSKVQFEGRAVDGRAIAKEQMLALANAAIAGGKTEVSIPLAVVLPRIEISEDLQMLGIRELIGVGHTRFKGSPVNRIHNIGVGMSRFAGLLIPPGETFSFDKNLGKVDASTGYRKELVIKPEGTIPDFGGGLCQVSSTMYRAALYTGLPIVDRTPHTYAVTYYSQIGGHGLDATIYPPSRDLKFTNDTPGFILIQSYIDGFDAYFKFYGASDGRKVKFDGPYISNHRAPPEEAVTLHDSQLQPGEKKQVEKPHAGFDVLWYRYITKDGDVKKEEIFTRYKAVPAKFAVGEELTPEGENAGISE